MISTILSVGVGVVLGWIGGNALLRAAMQDMAEEQPPDLWDAMEALEDEDEDADADDTDADDTDEDDDADEGDQYAWWEDEDDE